MNIDLSDANYKEIIAALVGTALIVIGYSMAGKRKKMITSGVRVQGIVFDIEREVVSFNNNKTPSAYPIIRFVTLEKEWVTEKYSYAVSSSSSFVGLINAAIRLMSFMILQTSQILYWMIFFQRQLIRLVP